MPSRRARIPDHVVGHDGVQGALPVLVAVPDREGRIGGREPREDEVPLELGAEHVPGHLLGDADFVHAQIGVHGDGPAADVVHRLGEELSIGERILGGRTSQVRKEAADAPRLGLLVEGLAVAVDGPHGPVEVLGGLTHGVTAQLLLGLPVELLVLHEIAIQLVGVARDEGGAGGGEGAELRGDDRHLGDHEVARGQIIALHPVQDVENLHGVVPLGDLAALDERVLLGLKVVGLDAREVVEQGLGAGGGWRGCGAQ